MGQKGQYLAQNDEKCQMWLFLHALSCHLEKEVDVCEGKVILARKYSLNKNNCNVVFEGLPYILQLKTLCANRNSTFPVILCLPG